MDVVVTLPKSVRWEDYEEELRAAEAGAVMSFKVPRIPKDVRVGDRCYIAHNGFVRGYMVISGLDDWTEFACTTTGREWRGRFIQRTGRFTYITPVPMKGFQGFRYWSHEE